MSRTFVVALWGVGVALGTPVALDAWSSLRAARARAALADAHVEAARAALEGGAPARAVVGYSTALELDPARAEALLGRARAQAVLVARAPDTLTADTAVALQHELAVARSLGAPAADADLALGDAWAARRLGQTEDAARAFTRAAELAPERADVQIALARFLLETKRAAEAEALLARAVELDAQSAAAWRALGETRLALKKPSVAADALRKAAELAPSPSAWRLLGEAELAHAAYAAAATAFGAAVEALEGRGERPDAGLLEDLGLARFRAGDVPAARTALQAALQARRAPGTFYNLGLVELAAGRPAEALAAFDEALSLRADLAEARVKRVAALVALGRRADAEAAVAAMAADSGPSEAAVRARAELSRETIVRVPPHQ